MNIAKLKGRMVEKGINAEGLAAQIEIDRSTMYRKLNSGEKFTIGEAKKIKEALELTNEDASVIFFG